ncbi:MAG: DUF3604 domain-containing protein [Hyphomonas sp.]|uniref:DUF3604 domain-containing protein n=1 Tax=Hyphomonas sp. TaxID=87 RepID=UPI003527774B
MKHLALASASLFVLAACGTDTSTDAAKETLAAAEPAVTMDAPADPSARVALFGDLHVHTGQSFDAFIANVRATPDDAYRFAKGEKLHIEAGYDIQLESGPLDFLAVTDHGEYMGILPVMATPGSALSQTDFAKSVFGPDAVNPGQSFQNVGITIVTGEEVEEIYDRDVIDSAWGRAIDAANRHYEPGKFTTFAGYEFTAMTQVVEAKTPAAANLHRNVIFRGEAPDRLFSTLDSTNPEDLWDWMDGQRADGRDVMSIPHNSNASNGEMFAMETYEGGALTADYATTRMRNEPVMEITQIKGTSETHPSLSPNDEWAGFELYESFIGSAEKSSPHTGDFARTALGRGLALQGVGGFNPYKFGFIGSSDTHIAAGPFIEEKFWGKFPADGASPEARHSVPPDGAKTWDVAEVEVNGPIPVGPNDMRRLLAASQYSASGLAGVWADENTREAIFDAIRRKETFGTSGPRIKARMFAGFGFDASLLSDPDLVAKAYAAGVPQGGELSGGDGTAPGILAWAMRDSYSYPLQRLQVVKVWTDAANEAHETVYDAACSGGALPDPETHRCPDNGASVNLADCSTNDGTGVGELKALWHDPAFDPSQRAAYYVRVLENPSCRWSSWDAARNGTPPNPDMPSTIQERAWTSPVWYNPE